MEKEKGRRNIMESLLPSKILRRKTLEQRTQRPKSYDFGQLSDVLHDSSLSKGCSRAAEQSYPDELSGWNELIGHPVCIGGIKEGILRYYGRTKFSDGLWCGVELQESVGKNDGTVNGVKYFSCKPNHGIFAPVTKVSLLSHDRLNYLIGDQNFYRKQNDPTQRPTCPDFLKPSSSDSNSEKRSSGIFCSYINEGANILGDKRSLTEQRDQRRSTYNGNEFKVDEKTTLPYVFNQCPPSSNVYTIAEHKKLSSESKSFEIFGYSKADEEEYMSFPRKVMSEYSLNAHSRKSALAQSHSCPHSALGWKKSDVELSARRAPQNTLLIGDRELDPKFGSHPCQPTFKSYISSSQLVDFQDDNDDDQMSLDYDESLGILTPSEMKDFTLCADLPTSRSDTRAIDFPSSESFDEVNDLPEDEQVHDVSVQYVSSTSTFVQSVAVSKASVDSAAFPNKYMENRQISGARHVLSSTNKFLSSISSNKDANACSDSGYPLPRNEVFDCKPGEYEEIDQHMHCLDTCAEDCNSIPEGATENSHKMSIEEQSLERDSETASNVSFPETAESSEFIGKLLRFDGDAKTKKNYETDSSRDSLLQTEEQTMCKEKLTVSWEDCVADSPDDIYSKVERPESVYTVGSNDTGYQEDGEFEQDAGMTTSVESSEGKRFSTFSRDSCAAEEDIDADKVGESTSTSGYSTGLSDSCCNERHEEGMCRPMEDSFQDVGDSCNSDDAMIFGQEPASREENASVEKSEGFFDMDSFKDPESISDFHITESSTVLGLDSTCETLSETIVEDVTIVDLDQNTVVQAIQLMEEDVPKCNGTIPNTNLPNSTNSIVPQPEKIHEPKRQSIFNVSTGKRDSIRDIIDVSRKPDVKSPRRNVMSKIKAVIGGNRSKSNDHAEQVKRSSTPKKSRWEAVTSKIAASLAEEKTKPKIKKEVRSRVDTNLTAARSCHSPRLDLSSASEGNRGDLSVASSTSSKSRKTDRQRTLTKNRECRNALAASDHGTKSPRPSKTRSSSRSTSPVAVSESSTSVSLTSHHSRSKIAIWKGSNSTVASSVAPVQLKKLPPATTFRNANMSSRMCSKEVGKSPTAAKLRANICPVSPRLSTRLECSPKTPCSRLKSSKEQGSGGRPLVAPRPIRPPMWLSKAELSQEIQHLSTLCEARTKELNRLKMDTRHATTGFDALAVVIRYMTAELNAFKNPTLATDLREAQENLNKGKKDLEYYEKEIGKLNSLHAKEVDAFSEKLTREHEVKLQELIGKHNEQIAMLDEQHQKEARSLTEALRASCEEERQQHQKMLDKLQLELKTQREEMEIFQQHELNDLEEGHLERQKSLMSEIEKLQKQCEDAKVLSLTMEEALQKDTDSKLQWLSAKRLDLQNEVDSLKAVLEIKNNELHSLRKENLEMQKELEELPLAREKIKMLQARAEDLQALMAEKVRLERQLSTEHESMKEIYEREEKINKRLSMENEELIWKLKQATESSLLSTSVPDEHEPDELPEYSDLSSSCPPAVFEEPLSPTKSPKVNSRSKPMFFTYMNQEELSARSPQSPKTQYKRIQPHMTSSAKTPSSRSPRRSTDSSPHCSEGTPRKMARQISRNASNRRHREESAESSKLDHPIAAAVANDSLLSSASSENSLFEPCLLEEQREQICARLEILQEQRSSDPSSLHFEEANGETIDPKSYYHMAFPVKEVTPDVDCDDATKRCVPRE